MNRDQVDATSRSELRELNELNFARFDAKLEQRVAELRQEFREGLATLRNEVVKWMFVFWAGNAVTTAGLVLVVVNLVRRG